MWLAWCQVTRQLFHNIVTDGNSTLMLLYMAPSGIRVRSDPAKSRDKLFEKLISLLRSHPVEQFTSGYKISWSVAQATDTNQETWLWVFKYLHLLTLSVPCFSDQTKHKIYKNTNCVQQQCELESILIESFHLSGHTFIFCWAVQDLEVFLVSSNLPLAVKGFIVLRTLYTSIFLDWSNFYSNF